MSVKLVECPRDAMQGFHNPIPTAKKIEYINSLLNVGFDTIDCGSFVSARAVPQLADTAEVLNGINYLDTKSKLLCIVANERGAESAAEFAQISMIGFPFSISETFQLRNTRQTIEEAKVRLQNIKSIADDSGKELLVYISMGFGNPYNDEWSPEITTEWCEKIADIGVKYINLSDTIGAAIPEDIASIFNYCSTRFKDIEFGAHFHTRPDNYLSNISAAFENDCRKFDAAIRGFGGCPFAHDKLTGNLPTESLLAYLESIREKSGLDREAFNKAFQLAASVFV